MRRPLALIAAAILTALPALAQDTLQPVKLVTVDTAGGGLARQFFGRVVARQTVDLAFQVPGQIEQLPAIEGEVTPRGELLAQLDLFPYELALRQARLQAEQAERAVERYRQLQGSAVSQVQLDDAITAADLARVAVSKAENDLEHATLHAPYDALVAQRMVDNFTTIAAGTPVVRVHDMSELRIEIDVPEVLFQKAGKSPDVEVTATFPASDEVFPLEVREFNAETSSVGQTFRLTFGMPPPSDLRILPGSSVTVTAVLRDGEPFVAVPATALFADGAGGLAAMKFEPGSGDAGRVERVAVRAEPTARGQMRVLEGLAPGDEIVAMGAATLESGAAVRRFTGFGQ